MGRERPNSGRLNLCKLPLGEYKWQLTTRNQVVLLTSPVYKSRRAALTGIALIRVFGAREDNYFFMRVSDGRYYCAVANEDGKVIGRSNLYKNNNRILTIAEIIRDVVGLAKVQDFTRDIYGKKN